MTDPARRPRSSIVLQGVPKSMTPDQVSWDLVHGNGNRWRTINKEDLDNVTMERLNRRAPVTATATAGAGQDSRHRSQWIPSATIRVSASTTFCKAVLEDGGAVVGYSFRHARPFERAPIRCFRCGEMGFHVGKYCRNKPRCRHCGKGHETTDCPEGRAASPNPQRARQGPHPRTDAGGTKRGAASSS